MNIDIDVSGLQHQLDTIEEMQLQWGEFAGYAVGTDVEYAIYVEYGTYKMQPNKALRNAMMEVMSQIDTMAARADDSNDLGKMIAESIKAGWRRDVWVNTGKLRDSIEVVKVD